MAKIKLDEEIIGLDGQPINFDLEPNALNVLQTVLNTVSKELGKESLDKVMNGLDGKLKKTLTYKDAVMTSLMISESDNPDEKLADYKLLQEVSTGTPDLGATEIDRIMSRIGKTYRNVVILGRCDEKFRQNAKSEK